MDIILITRLFHTMRNTNVDLMRVMGLFLIILAHVNPPEILFQIRTFDVPMMVFISGMAFYCAGKNDVSIVSYITSRFKRLILPVWAFLIIFFTSIYLVNIDSFMDLLSVKTIFSTFMLSGFGYVWIIRVFMIIAVLSPTYVMLVKNRNGAISAIIGFCLLSLATMLSFIDQSEMSKILSKLLTDVFIPMLSYGAVFILGFKCLSIKKSEKIFSFSLFALSFVIMLVFNKIYTGTIHSPQDYKYPPSMYYISYSVAMSYLILAMTNHLLKYVSRLPKSIQFLSSNTIWIYLWHIPFVEYFKREQPDVSYIIKYLITIFIAITIASIQIHLVKKLTKNDRTNLLRAIFTG